MLKPETKKKRKEKKKKKDTQKSPPAQIFLKSRAWKKIFSFDFITQKEMYLVDNSHI